MKEFAAEDNWSGGGGRDRLLDRLEGKPLRDALPEEYTLPLSGEEEVGGYSCAKWSIFVSAGVDGVAADDAYFRSSLSDDFLDSSE